MFCARHNVQVRPTIQLLNVQQNDQFNHSIVLIRGEISNYNHRHGVTHLQIVNEHAKGCIESAEITINGTFKVAVELSSGDNQLNFQFCCVTKEISLIFKKRENPRYLLRIIYIICQNHNGHFQAPDNADNSVERACKKINLAIRVVQCLYAEMLAKHGFNRKTFEFIACKPFYSSLSVDVSRQWDQLQLWTYHAKEILAQESDIEHRRCKYFGILASTVCENGAVKGNAALGIGDVSLFGSGTLYTWPSNFDCIQKCFHDETSVDRNRLMDDSNGRNTFGGCYATALGSMCHEIGHIFDLGHTSDGIMGNDIDYVNRMFTIEKFPRDLPRRIASKCLNEQNQGIDIGSITNSQHSQRRRVTTIKKTNPILTNYHCRRNDDLTFLTENCAVLLNVHKWFNQTTDDDHIDSNIRYDSERMIIESVLPLALVELRTKENGMCIKYYRFDVLNSKRFRFTITAEGVCQTNYDLIVLDSNGNIMKWKG